MKTQRERLSDAVERGLWPEAEAVLAEAQNPPPLGSADGSIDEWTWTLARDAVRAIWQAEAAARDAHNAVQNLQSRLGRGVER
jgi:hypothetical protein